MAHTMAVKTRPDDGPALSTLAEQYLKQRVARREITVTSAANHRYILGRFVRDLADCTDNVTLDGAERWLEDRASLQPGSRRTHFGVVKLFCAWLTRHDYIAKNPMLELCQPRQPWLVPRALPADAITRLLKVVDRPRDRAMIWVAVGMGLRCCEISGAEMSDWDRKAGTLLVRGKGSHERVLPVPREAGAALGAYVDEQRPGGASGPVFRSYRFGAPGLSPKSISRLLGEWMFAADVKHRARDGVGAHSLRHTAASDVLEKSRDVRLVQNMLGHSNVATTSRYLRIASMGQLRDAMEGRDYGDEGA